MNRRRLAVILAGVAAFINLYAPQSLLPLLRAWIGDDAARAGLIVSAGTFGVALAAPFTGLLADRYGRRRVIVIAAFLAVIPGLFAGLAPTPEALMAIRLVQGLCLPGIFAVTVAYIAEEWPAAEARAVTAVYVAGTIGGGFVGRSCPVSSPSLRAGAGVSPRSRLCSCCWRWRSGPGCRRAAISRSSGDRRERRCCR